MLDVINKREKDLEDLKSIEERNGRNINKDDIVSIKKREEKKRRERWIELWEEMIDIMDEYFGERGEEIR